MKDYTRQDFQRKYVCKSCGIKSTLVSYSDKFKQNLCVDCLRDTIVDLYYSSETKDTE